MRNPAVLFSNGITEGTICKCETQLKLFPAPRIAREKDAQREYFIKNHKFFMFFQRAKWRHLLSRLAVQIQGVCNASESQFRLLFIFIYRLFVWQDILEKMWEV